jgi:tyrosine-protein phosphatase YwqE
MVEAGFSKVIATPHVMKSDYENTFESIRDAKSELVSELEKQRIPLKVETAAEYFLDVTLLDYVKGDYPLLTIGAKGQRPYLLVETGIREEPDELEELIIQLDRRNIRLILAHPENYIYLQNNFDRAIEIFRKGIYFQVNWGSFHNGIQPEVTRFLHRLVDYRMASFVGSNLHHEIQIPLILEAAKQPYFHLMTEIGLMNNDFE